MISSDVMNKKRAAALLFVLLFILAFDIVTKALTVNFVPMMPWASPFYPYGGIGIFKDFLGVDFSVNYVSNRGSAWGLFAQWQNYLLGVRIFAIICLSVYLFAFNQLKARQIPLLLIIAGAFGNVIDFFLYGHVVDMFHFNAWGFSCPVFNVADASIFFGVLAMFILSMKKKKTDAIPTYTPPTS